MVYLIRRRFAQRHGSTSSAERPGLDKTSDASIVNGTELPYFAAGMVCHSFLWPLIVINSADMATVPLGLNMFRGQHGNQWHLLMAASTISMLPSLFIVLLLQRHLVRGIAISGLGGR